MEKRETIALDGRTQQQVKDSGLVPGGTIGNSPSAAELAQTFHEDNPTMALPDQADRYAAGAVVENLGSIFENAQISGGNGRNILVVGDSDGKISVGVSTRVMVEAPGANVCVRSPA
ncbi:MAG TPA: hypothetical protein VF494_03305, partial [Candidatus Limnocylindrales bacterium]